MSWQGNINAGYLAILGRPATASDIQGKLNIYTDNSISDKNEHLKKILADVSKDGSGRSDAIKNAYRTFLGRNATEAEVRQKSGKGGSTQDIITGIARDTEAIQFKNSLASGYTGQYSNQVRYGEGGNNSNQGYSSTAINNGVSKSVWESNNSYWKLPNGGTNSNMAYYASMTNWSQVGRNTTGSSSRTIQSQQIITLKNGGLAYSDSAQKLLSNGAKNTYNRIMSQTNNSKGGNYKSILNNITSLDSGSRQYFAQGSKNIIDQQYREDVIKSPWNPGTQAIAPPTGGFDAKYYLDNNGNIKTAWDAANNNMIGGIRIPDLDITARYTDLDTFANADYTRRVASSEPGVRGNAAVDTDEYSEAYDDLTDAEKAAYRDTLLGLTEEGASGTRSIDWTRSDSDSIFELQVDVNFAGKDLEEQDKFGTLTQDSLKFAAAELAKQQEANKNLELYKSIPGFNEIYSANETLANSILGDSGIGGYLAMLGKDTEAIQEDLEDQVSNFTGISTSNSVVFNWEKWYEEDLVKRYEEMENITVEFDDTISDIDVSTEIGKTAFKVQLERMGIDPFNDAGELISKQNALQQLEDNNFQRIYEVDEEFKTNFIEKYLKPRFDSSRSMDEFISYMDVMKDEQNIFQTQSALDSLKTFASSQARVKLDQIKGESGAFDYEFYFDPTKEEYGENEAKQVTYDKQKEQVLSDWNKAKGNGNSIPTGQKADSNGNNYTWNQWAYFYGEDLNDKNSFARLHYQVIGASEGFDPGRDILTKEDVDDYLFDIVLPAIDEKGVAIGDATFMDFVTPEEFAEEVLRGIDPLENEEEWKEVLKMYGLDEGAALEEVRTYIIEAVRTGAAKDIREGIKYLNEKRKKPTQEKLGISYIQRDEDEREIDDENASELYKIFQNAGYTGSEDEFFDTFMPDADRSDIAFIQRGLSGDFDLKDLNSDDPFETLATMGEFLGDSGGNIFGTESDGNTEGDSEESNYFSLFDEDEDDYASDTGRSIIDGYTDFFK